VRDYTADQRAGQQATDRGLTRSRRSEGARDAVAAVAGVRGLVAEGGVLRIVVNGPRRRPA
jgi:hypothetical protein